jgi:HEAT repeat protein
MFPVRPVGWAAAVMLLTVGCSTSVPPQPPPEKTATPTPPSPPGAVVAAVPQPTTPQPEPVTGASPPGGPGWTYPQAPKTPPTLNGTTPAPAPAPAPKPQPPAVAQVPPGTQTQPSIPGVPPAPPGTPPSTFPPSAPPKKEEPKKGPSKKDEWPKSVNGRSLGEWMTDFKNPDPAIRDAAIKVMPLFGPEARKNAPKELIRLINDPDPGVMINAMLILGAVGTDNKDELRAAAKAMSAAISKTAPGSMIRLHATRTLAAMGTDAYDAIATVVGIANDPSWETRQAVAAALGRLGAGIYEDKPQPPGAPYKVPTAKRQPSKTAMDKLVYALLKDESAAVRMEAMQSMIVLGPPYTTNPALYPKLVAPYLAEINQRLKQEKDDTVKIWLYVVQMMYDDRTVEGKDGNMVKIAEYLTSREDAIKVQALGALAILGPRARPVVANIAECAKDPEQTVAVAALTTLVGMGNAAKLALDDLQKQMAVTKDKDLKKLFEDAIKIIKEGRPEPEPKKDDTKKKDDGKKKEEPKKK